MDSKKRKSSGAFTPEEVVAMKERARELKAAAGGKKTKTDGEGAISEKIAEMAEPDRTIAKKLHALIRYVAPALEPRTWYGMPAYAKDGRVLCFFQSAQKFKTRYATLGFTDAASLDEGPMWPTAFAMKEWNSNVEASIRKLLEKATGG